MERLKTGIILLLLAALAGSVAWAATGGEAEVRITARRLEDGRTEFALQQRVDGEWGERIAPTQRFFPAAVDHGRWLNSSPITVTTASEEPAASAPTAGEYTPQRVARGANEDETVIWNTEDTAEGFISYVAVFGDTDDGTFDQAVAYVACNHSDPQGAVGFQVRTFYSVGEAITFHNGFDGSRQAGWRIGASYNPAAIGGTTSAVSDSAVWIGGEGLLAAAMEQRWLTVVIPTWADEVNYATFDLSEAWNTPVQENLANCGR